MRNNLTGRAWVYGDNIDTDVIFPARYLSLTEPGEMAKHCMEDCDPNFAHNVRHGDIVVAGHNFGCGSNREHAPLAFIGAGVAAIAAASFSMIFYRNAINLGLPIFECSALPGAIAKGDVITFDPAEGTLVNHMNGKKFTSAPFPPFLLDLMRDGGLVQYTRKRLDLH